MQHLLEKNGFVRCGIIHLANGAPRIAYQFAGGSTDYRDGSQQPVSGEQPQQNYDPQTPDQSWSVREVPSGGRGFGIASMVLGIISLVLFFSFVNIPLAILAIIFGIIHLRDCHGHKLTLSVSHFLDLYVCVSCQNRKHR